MPTIQVEGGPEIEFPDSMSQAEIYSALNELTDKGTFGNRKQGSEVEGFGDALARAGRNVFNAPLEIASTIVETPAVIGEFVRNVVPFLNDSAPFEDMALHKAADWVRSLEMSHGDQQKPEGVTGFLTDTLPGMGGTMLTVAAAAGAAEAAIPVGVGAALLMAGQQGVNAFKEARDAGADDTQQFTSWLVNSGIGAASAVPISRWLNAQPSKDLLKMGLKEGSINAVTAFFQQLATNAADKAIWDKDRPWLQGVGEMAAAGLTVGGLMGLALAGTAKRAPGKPNGPIKDPGLKAAAQIAETSNASETAKAIADVDVVNTESASVVKLDPIVEDPSHIVDPRNQTILHEEQKRLEAEANPEQVIEAPVEKTKPLLLEDAKPQLTEAEKASLQGELEAELGQADPIEPIEPQPLPKPDGVPRIEGREIPAEVNHVVEKVKRAITGINKAFGNLIDNVVIQDLQEGAGIASAARSGEHGTIVLDPLRLAEAERNGASLNDLIKEEVIHSLQGKAVRDLWTKLGEPGEFRDYWDKHFTDIAKEMSESQKQWIQKIYGSELKSPIQQAVEFVRATLQEKYTGRVSEAGYSRAQQPAFTNLLNVFKEFWKGFKGKKGEMGKLAKQQMQAIDNLLKEGKKNNKRVEPKVEPESYKPTEATTVRYGDTHLYRETSAAEAASMSERSFSNMPFGAPEVYFATDPNLAIGQGKNKGVLLTFDNAFKTKENTQKPGLKVSESMGHGGERTAKIQNSELKKHLREVTIKKGLEGNRVELAGLRSLVRELESKGWHKTVGPDGEITLSREKPNANTTRTAIESAPANDGSKTVVSNVEGNQAKPATEANAGDAKGSASVASAPRQPEATATKQVTLPESFQESLYNAAQKIVDSAGMDDVNKEFAFDYIQSKLHERAEAYFQKNGNLDKFSASTVGSGLLKDFYKRNSAQKRSGNKISLDAPMGEEGEATIGDTISKSDTVEGDKTEQQRKVEAVQTAMQKLPKETQEILNAVMEGHGGLAKLAKAKGIPENTLRSRLKVAQKQLARELLGTQEGKELFAPDDLVNASNPSDNPLRPDEEKQPLARNLDVWTRFQRLISPDRWAYEGEIRDFANTTNDPQARETLNKLATRVVRYYDKVKEVSAKTLNGIFETLNTVDKEQEKAIKAEWEMFHAVMEARDGGITAAQAKQNAMTQIYPTLSPKAKALVDFRMSTGSWTGQFLNGLNGGIGLLVKVGKKVRVFKDLGENFYPRQLSQEIDMVLNDPDAPTNRARFSQLMDELVNNNPDQFPTREEAEAYWKERGRDSITSGDYYAGADMGRGVKLPDSWHDYTLEGYIKGREQWAQRVSQIWAFGQDAPAEMVKGEVVRPALMNAFDEAIRFATSQSDGAKGEKGLKVLLGQIRDDVFGTRQARIGDEWVRYLRSVGTIRYLSAILSSVRNVGQGIISTAEQAGARNAIMAASKGLYDASRAIYKSVKAGRFIEPDMVAAAGEIGAFQRSMAHQTFYDLDPVKPAQTALGKAGQYIGDKLLLGQHLSEGWNRGMSAAAFGLWSRDAVRAFAHNPMSREVLKARAQLQRWGFTSTEQARFFAGDSYTINRFIRVAVHEKQYGYKGDQVPALFRAPGFQLLTLFQSWGVQRTRDFTRNVWRPMFYGEDVSLPGGQTARVRDPMPMVRFIVGTMAGAAALNLLKDKALGRKLKDPSWEEILNAGDEDTSNGVKMALGRIVNDLTASGGMGLVPDYLRATKDWATQGRSKSLANSPALQIASDLTDLIKAQVGREGDPRAFWRDFRDILLLRTPVAREVNNFATHMLIFGEDAQTLFDSRQTISLGRALMKRWTNETGRDNLLKKHSYTGDKTPNSEFYDQIYENILEGDTVRAGELVNEFTDNRRDRKKLAQIQASIRGRTPLAGEARLTPLEMREFISWAKTRNPEAGEKIDSVIKSYHTNVNKLGFR